MSPPFPSAPPARDASGRGRFAAAGRPPREGTDRWFAVSYAVLSSGLTLLAIAAVSAVFG